MFMNTGNIVGRFRRHLTDRCRSKAFTLVELLVVIAIIAMLLAVLMPSLNRARELGRSITCRTNLKNMGMAFNLYSNENNEIMLAEDILYSENGQARWKPWMVCLLPYWGVKIDLNKAVWDKVGALKAFRCPSQSDPWVFDNSGVHYGINVINTSHYDVQTGGFLQPVTKRSNITQQAFRMHVVDTLDDTRRGKLDKSKLRLPDPSVRWPHNWVISRIFWPSFQYDIPASNRHNGGSNILFLDWHIEQIKYGDIMPYRGEKTSNPGAWNKKQRLWDYRTSPPYNYVW
jgi:prepilin-type processing-associated H-X9-DG protein/prepilin-type N-terminal cleavage/methylation domain-containing protein